MNNGGGAGAPQLGRWAMGRELLRPGRRTTAAYARAGECWIPLDPSSCGRSCWRHWAPVEQRRQRWWAGLEARCSAPGLALEGGALHVVDWTEFTAVAHPFLDPGFFVLDTLLSAGWHAAVAATPPAWADAFLTTYCAASGHGTPRAVWDFLPVVVAEQWRRHPASSLWRATTEQWPIADWGPAEAFVPVATNVEVKE